ncbi:MAG: biotin/lipoate A/B protein ligase family protein [Methanobacteriota archaeon]
MQRLRVIDTDLAHPFRTGALDEAILRTRARDETPDTLHFYRREPPGVSLGYFGKAGNEVDLDYCKGNGISLLRRLSGGSAIYTDRNQLVYAFASKGALPTSPNAAYAVVCGALVFAFERLGVEAEFKPVNDVQHIGKKLSGSALTRRWGAHLVHGTVLVAVDREKMFRALRVDAGKVRSKNLPEPGARVTSLAEILGKAPAMESVKAAVVAGFEEQFGMKAALGKLAPHEKELADRLVAEKYGTDEWNLKR